MRVKKPPSASRPPRVVWTAGEKEKLIRRAVDIQSENPDLAGLPLLRVAMQVLPETRWRRLLAVTQAPFFEPGVAAEVKRRTIENRAGVDLGVVAREHAQTADEIVRLQREWRALHEEWRQESAQTWQSVIALLAMILKEMQLLNAMLGQPVYVQAPSNGGEPKPAPLNGKPGKH